jgi:hypothetical protein
VCAGTPVDQHERHPARGEVVAEPAVEGRVAQHKTVDSAVEEHVDLATALLGVVMGVGDERVQPVLGSRLLQTLVDGGRRDVGHPWRQHPDEVAALGAQACRVRVGYVAQLDRQRTDALSRRR